MDLLPSAHMLAVSEPVRGIISLCRHPPGTTSKWRPLKCKACFWAHMPQVPHGPNKCALRLLQQIQRDHLQNLVAKRTSLHMERPTGDWLVFNAYPATKSVATKCDNCHINKLLTGLTGCSADAFGQKQTSCDRHHKHFCLKQFVAAPCSNKRQITSRSLIMFQRVQVPQPLVECEERVL